MAKGDEKDLQAREAALATKEADLATKEADLAAREKALASKAKAAPADKKPKELSAADKALLAKGRAAYGIADEYVFNQRIDDSDPDDVHAVIATVGGEKIRYRDGDEKAEGFERLHPIRITGDNPEAKKRKAFLGKKKEK